MKLNLPKQDPIYQSFLVKRNITRLIQRRGFIIGKSERFLLDENLDNRSGYRKFRKRFEPDEDDPYTYLNEKYKCEDASQPNLKLYFCHGSQVNEIYSSSIPDNIKKINDKKKSKKEVDVRRDFLFVVDGNANFMRELPKDVRVEILLFHQMLIDPRKHMFSSKIEVMFKEEIDELFEGKNMTDKTTTLISENDPMYTFAELPQSFSDFVEERASGVKVKRMLRITTDNHYCGPPKQEISYRIVK